MIRLANPSDLDAIAEIYEEILAAEDARPVSYSGESTPPGIRQRPPWRRAPCGWGRKMERYTAAST